MKPLYISLVPSGRIAILLIVVHSGAATLGALLPIAVALKWVLIVSAAWSLKRTLEAAALLRGKRATIALRVTGNGHFFVQTRGGAWLECELLPSSYVSSCLTILNLRACCNRQLRHVVLCCGNATSDDVRRLRTWLRWAAGNPQIPTSPATR